ncbi:hypothetical protein KJ966_25795 [bacterium]|nr:hypothetical protein [bacterium]
MANILVITHGNLAAEFVKIAETITNRKGKAIPVCFDLDTDSDCSQKINSAIDSLDSGQSVIILTDLFGGTPSNMAIPFIQKNKVEVITGLNLPMLLFLLTQPEDKDFEELCRGAKQASQESIIIAGEFLH